MTSTVSDMSVEYPTEVIIARDSDKNIGSADQTSPSLSSLLSTLAPVALYASISLIVFLVFQRWFPDIYHPRKHLKKLRLSERTSTLSKAFTSCFGGFFDIPDVYVLEHNSIDAYLFLRLLKLSVIACIVGSLICIPILIPVNATGGGGQEQLNIITMSNVTNSHRFFAHAGCAYMFFGLVIYMVNKESIYYIKLRQAYLLSPYYTNQLSSRTVLFSSVPKEYLIEEKLRGMLGAIVRRVWFVTNVSALEDEVYQRDKAAMKLEKAKVKYIKAANAARPKAKSDIVKVANESRTRRFFDETAFWNDSGMVETNCSPANFLSLKDRPTHRLKPLFGRKVDTIDWCCTELEKLIPKVKGMQVEQRRMGPDIQKLNSVFVEFATIKDAQAAHQSLIHHQAMHMAPRFIGITPKEIIWSNLRIRWWERKIRTLLTVSFVSALIIFWSVPVAFIGSISNITSLITLLPFLSFLLKIPSTIRGVVTGLLPSLLLSILMSMVPVILRIMAKLGGDPSLSAVELTVQNTYFGFQIVQVFLVATLGSAASAAVGEIVETPGNIPSLLAQSIPKASNFYLSYIVLQGLGVASSLLLGVSRLSNHLVLGKLLDKTPRQMNERRTILPGLHWGTIFPVYTNLLVIAICYSCIAPLVLVFAAVGLYLSYLAYRYHFLFVANCQVDTKGRVYPRALQQIFVGLYVAETCLLGLFAIATRESIDALGPLILMIILIVFTAIYHICLNSAIDPLINYIPRSLIVEDKLAQDEARAVGDSGKEAKSDLGHVPHQAPTFSSKFLRPDLFTDCMTSSLFMSLMAEKHDESESDRDAYLHPSMTSETPRLWIPRDHTGISQREADNIPNIIRITREGAFLNDKNKIVLYGV